MTAGNAVCSFQTQVTVLYCSTHLCGPTRDLCSDSSMCFKYKKHEYKYTNASNNFGFEGGNLVSFWDCEPGINVTYCQAVHAIGDYAFIEFINNGNSIDRCNFKDGAGLRYLFHAHQSSSVSNTIIIDTDKPLSGEIFFNFINCHSNIKIQDYNIDIESEITTYIFDIIPDSCYNNKNIRCKCYSEKFCFQSLADQIFIVYLIF